jgi:hypothetical protein
MGRQQRRAAKRYAAARKTHVPKELVLYAHRGGGSIPPRPENLDMPDHKYRKWYAKVTTLLGQGKTVSDLPLGQLKEYIRDFSAAGALSPQMHQRLLSFVEKDVSQKQQTKRGMAIAKARKARDDVVYRGSFRDVWTNPATAVVLRAPRATTMLSNAAIQRTNQFRGIDPKTGISVSNAVNDVGGGGASVEGGMLKAGRAHSYASTMRNVSRPAQYYGRRFNMPPNPSDGQQQQRQQLVDIGKLPGSKVGSRVWKPPTWHPQQLVQPPTSYRTVQVQTGPLGKRVLNNVVEEVVPRGKSARMRTGDYMLYNPPPPTVLPVVEVPGGGGDDDDESMEDIDIYSSSSSVPSTPRSSRVGSPPPVPDRDDDNDDFGTRGLFQTPPPPPPPPRKGGPRRPPARALPPVPKSSPVSRRTRSAAAARNAPQAIANSPVAQAMIDAIKSRRSSGAVDVPDDDDDF